jgi:hypothetical protein
VALYTSVSIGLSYLVSDGVATLILRYFGVRVYVTLCDDYG